ncbi:MAG TPA: TA system VapC family ribonuclease toxin [Pseudomonadales bacterium]|nr:TA system VapC family ribonuclease toxin [Pseudomonadales bacterium]
MTPDINVLVAASRADHVHNGIAYRWLTASLRAAANGARFDLLPMTIAGFLRLVTNERIFPDATPIEAAVEFIDALLDAPGVDVLALGGEWRTLQRMLLDEGLSGNAIPDAWIAAAVRANGCHLVTFDRGFRRLLGKRELTVLAAR